MIFITIAVLGGGSVAAANERENDGRFWSFRPVHRPVPPSVGNGTGLESPIDCFVQARLGQHGLAPVAPADRRTLIRRAALDLTGLPPTPDEVDTFFADDAPDAYSRLLDRLLASPHYGERWARHWLDVARYGDNDRNGGSSCSPLPNAFRYRDWVIEAFNGDLPYDQFVTLQVAGDLIADAGYDGIRAVGFFAVGPTYESDGGDPVSTAKASAETLDDKVDTLSRGFLGLTVSCARCHDHKFDPIPTSDYYALAGVFQNTKLVLEAPLADASVVERYTRALAPVKELEKRLADAKGVNTSAKELDALRAELEELRKQIPPKYPAAHSLSDSGNEDMRISLGGDPMRPGVRVPRRMLQAVSGDSSERFDQGSGRLQLAQSLVRADNPLTSRVMVNRIWQHHFGRAIVETPDNFGQLGARPSHPQLLDWLASRLVENRWSIKKLHRDVLLSRTYQSSSRHHAAQYGVDPDNRWLWRANRRRLEVEVWRDTLLSVTGLIDRSMGGPPETDLLAGRRRTIYGFVSRDSATASDRFLKLFDLPDANISQSKRAVTTIPQQLLFAMNSDFMIHQAKALCRRLEAHSSESDARIRHGFRLLYGRLPQPEESEVAQRFLASDTAGELTRWQQYCQVLLASSELMYVE